MEATLSIINQYKAFLQNKDFPCVAARAAASRQQLEIMVASDMASAKQDNIILEFIYDFVEKCRQASPGFNSAVVIFANPVILNESGFDVLLWQRLQSLANLDAQLYPYDKRVAADPASAEFSFSIKEEAFFIIGLHPNSSRSSRQFCYPTLVFNPHAQFQQMKLTGQYERMKNIIRKRDIALSGSVNPMLRDFGDASEVYQYSGIQYNQQWQCPLKINHEKT